MDKVDVIKDILYWHDRGFYITPIQLAAIVKMQSDGKINSATAKMLIQNLKTTGYKIIKSLVSDEVLFETDWVFDLYFACYKEDEKWITN